MKKIKVFVVGKQKDYSDWIKDHVRVNSIKDCDLVIFTGGEDVSPSIYGEKTGKYTDFNTSRDLEEMGYFDLAKQEGKPMLGICRGSQFLCVMSGGRLVQHQENNEAVHPIVTSDGSIVLITSSHHQAQFPYEMDKKAYKLLAWTEGISKMHWDGDNKEISKEPFKEAEIVFYPTTNCLGIQGHPEWQSRIRYAKTFEYLDSLIDKLLNKSF